MNVSLRAGNGRIYITGTDREIETVARDLFTAGLVTRMRRRLAGHTCPASAELYVTSTDPMAVA